MAGLLQLNVELQRETALLLSSQVKATKILKVAQENAARLLRTSQAKAVKEVRARQRNMEAGSTGAHREALTAAYKDAAATLRETQLTAASLLMIAQREAAAVLMDATMRALDGRLLGEQSTRSSAAGLDPPHELD